MSKKLKSIFRKKTNKTDSHGTTAADEELQFQPVPPQNKQPTRLSAMQSNLQVLSMQPGHEYSASVTEDMHKDKVPRGSKRGNKDNERKVSANNKENSGETWMTERFQNLKCETEDDKVSTNLASIRRIDQIGSKDKFTAKQSTGLQMHGILEPPRDYVKDVSISDEYSDPFDAVHQKALLRKNRSADGYTEPYKAQRMHFEVSQGILQETHHRDDGTYLDPWDKKNESMGDYEDPWDSNKDATLPFTSKKSTGGNLHFDPDRNTHRKLHNGKPHNDSLSSVASSTSSASPSARRLVRVEHPRTSPRSSPHFDRRLILPSSNYSEPWGNNGGVAKFRPIDRRLIKAEPSLEELRRMPPSGPSSIGGTSSPHSSGRGSPDVAQLSRTSPSNSNSSQAGLPQHFLNMDRSKSKSLDMRNNSQALVALGNVPHMLPKSASDDHLTTMHTCNTTPSPSLQLNGLGEYEEPWDITAQSGAFANSYNNISHTRSRSYEMQGSPLACRNRSNQLPTNRVKPGPTSQDESFYEHPWDKGPADHLQSMQRFQQKRLELHPTEAINTRDFDPLHPLESQKWYHDDITRDEAEVRLSDKLEGSFLVRVSESTRDSYSLSVQSSKGCIHMLLRCTRDDSWILGEFSAPFLSAPEMVAYYTRNRLKISDSDYVLLSYPIADPTM